MARPTHPDRPPRLQPEGPRPRGSGSLFQRADGWWVAAVTFPNGRKLRRYAATPEAAAARLSELLRLRDGASREVAALARAPLKTLWEHFLHNEAPERLRPKTRATYASAGGRLVGELAAVRAERLTAAHITAALARLERAGMGPAARVQALAALRCCLRWAVQAGVLAHNVAEDVPPPRYEPGRRRILSADEARRLLAACLDALANGEEPLAVYVTLGLCCGLRRGEAAAVTWGDIDLDAGVLHVYRQRLSVNGRVMDGAPKTRRGTRTVPLSAAVRQALALARTFRPGGPGPTADGPLVGGGRRHDALQPPHPEVLRKVLKRLCCRAGVPVVAFHALRATYATLLARGGMDLGTLAALLGHSRAATTLGYAREQAPGRAAALLDRVFAVPTSGTAVPPADGQWLQIPISSS